MKSNPIHRFKTISEYHRQRGLPPPEHPLISLINFEEMQYLGEASPVSWSMDFYSIALKRNINGKIKYGQQKYDFDEGVLFFIAPGQIFSIEVENHKVLETSGWMLLVHPDFLWGTSLVQKIKKYDYFDYSINEALFLSEKEETSLINILQNIKQEYQSNIDKFSQDLIIAQLELFLKYADRFYNRQFLTRKISNHQILNRLEKLLDNYFEMNDLNAKSLPTVNTIAENLNVSPNYLSSMLKVLTGQTTQHHIHNKLIEKAKEKLSTTKLTVSEIAFLLGFEHSPSFSKLFKAKSGVSPLEFRNSFN
ncbi:helix-turn-helix domain-containing protein [Flavobacterium turcicum]|uniref:Helix-turn-helix transcriptional regulator n=1 Tax=Flavobacterium turcicum TaxID=2764718 RepID=A0ABR7JE87_9FLAO|nr:helix-turn-helix transcriptional regulator [Flavobacterium turcicum]MBC5862820.1 helix-turn-helix transcriptional regulator [Flavobacterium turcicum]NHL01552.1 helix-turn-helix transcriptional regulator [Flavobacterium turcicum]